jgi:hypothetical protein
MSWRAIFFVMLVVGALGSMFEKEPSEAETAAAQAERLKKAKDEDQRIMIEEANRHKADNAISILHCQTTIKMLSKFPTKADFQWSVDKRRDGDVFLVSGRVEMMNGLGLMIPHRYNCQFNADGGMINFTAVPG